MVTLTTTKSGSTTQRDIQLLGFEPATWNEDGTVATWVGVGRVRFADANGNVETAERRFKNLPVAVRDWLTSTGAQMLCTAMDNAL